VTGSQHSITGQLNINKFTVMRNVKNKQIKHNTDSWESGQNMSPVKSIFFYQK